MGNWNNLTQNHDKIYNGVKNKTWLQCGEKCMVSKDQTIGGAIFLVCVVVAIGYLVTLIYPKWLEFLVGQIPAFSFPIQFWLIAIPVVIAFIAVLAIGAWIGWTMATTPPPKPIEEIEAEEKEEEKKEEKKEKE